ncbi:unnamed protein product [Caenorhabditis bovis]|uniref:Multifunctional methyltransferase subunit TRM112-like protein n=1 Tax=Caenorhabditis bovis TaxID=2654633 RepID=A0A8S1F1F6_9PELO|nr:unnamed protein product [Caenorhabditis bovis]
MKLLTHNFVSSRFLKEVKNGYPLKLVAKTVKTNEVEMNEDFIVNIIQKCDYTALLSALKDLNEEVSLPEILPEDVENHPEILKELHRVLFCIDIVEGELVCPETGRSFPIRQGIPNLLAEDAETEPLFCTSYIRCMEELEIKQHECLEFDKSIRPLESHKCAIQKWEKKLELTTLHMRRTELARDCAQKSMIDAGIAESTISETERQQCMTTREVLEATLNSKQNRMENCRVETRDLHSVCSSLAKCCPLAQDCKQSTKEIMEQIYTGRQQLNALHDKCLD